MPRKLPRNVERNHVKGKTYLSFRKGKGPRIRLPDDPTSDEFMATYLAALSGDVLPMPQRIAEVSGTLGALIVCYKKDGGYAGLRSTTKVGYDRRLERLRLDHGHRTISGLTRERIITGILRPYADRPGAALDTLKKLRILVRHAIDIGWLRHDPTLGIKRPKMKRIRSWTEQEIKHFRSKWLLGTKQRTAFELFLNLGQRRSDVHRMAWPHITANKMTVVQQKTGRKLVLPLHKDLITALQHADRSHISILTTAYGRPFTVHGFSGWMRDAIKEAGLADDCTPHGLRKAAGRRLAEAGATARQIMAILGHTTLSEAERYSEEADQARLAADAVAKLEGHKWNENAQTARRGLGKTGKKDGKSK